MAKPRNLRRGNIGHIGGGIVDELNELKPGLGTKLVREINHRLTVITTQLDAQAGHKGTVTIAKQTGNDDLGKPKPGILLEDDRVTGVAFPKAGSDAVNLDYFRSFLTCDFFLQMVEDCLELPEATVSGAIPDCWRT